MNHFRLLFCANNTGNLVNSLFGVKVLIFFPYTFLSPFNDSMSCASLSLPHKSVNSISFGLSNNLKICIIKNYLKKIVFIKTIAEHSIKISEC